MACEEPWLARSRPANQGSILDEARLSLLCLFCGGREGGGLGPFRVSLLWGSWHVLSGSKLCLPSSHNKDDSS